MTRRAATIDTTPVVHRAPLGGVRVIEASAGTGKTWTIAGLYLRLLLERQAPVEGILAVTFTRAATAELRERIRARLQQLLDVLQGGGERDDLVDWLHARIADPAQARAQLTAALRGFDEAPIQTIHGFCQRALAEHAFFSGVAFDTELVPDLTAMLHEVAADFWRRRLVPATDAGEDPAARALLARWMLDQRCTLAELEKWARPYVRKVGLRLRRPARAPQLAPAIAAYAAAWHAARDAWRGCRDVVETLLRSEALNRNSYKLAGIADVCADVDASLAQAAPALALPKRLELFSREKLAASTKKGQVTPAHPFFGAATALLAAERALRSELDAWWRGVRLDFVGEAQAEIEQRFERRGAQSYDDLLRKLHAALQSDQGPALARALRQRYPYALIDEFQDTDAAQWGILHAIYGAADPERHGAFLVGDPKQAIYSFRGADVYAYLEAVAGTGEPLRLHENQRSVPGLVGALNALFGQSPRPFRHDAIRYDPVAAAPRVKAALVEGRERDAAPLRIAFLGGAEGDLHSLTRARDWATQSAADEIARLLAGAAAGTIRLGEAPLAAGDIAVLVNDRFHARAMREALGRRGISCAEISAESVYAAPEAEQLERVLLAVAAPRDAGIVRGALVSDLIGLGAPDLAQLESDEAWEAVLAEFEGYHGTWREHGLMRMLRELFRARDVPAQLARYRDGERRLTNLYHLCELLHRQEPRTPGLEALASWLGARRGDPASDETQLRLESDANLVQIVTIHKSKGLEYPVTFVPFLWDARRRVDDEIVSHHEAAPPHAPVLDGGSEDFAAASAAAREEELGERVRLAYVALTRAKNRCYLYTGAIAGNELSALGWLLHGVDGAADKPALPSEPQLRQQLDALVRAARGQARLVEPGQSAMTLPAAAPAPPALGARRLARPLPRGLALTSFSALHAALPRHDPDPLPDHDQAPADARPPARPLEPGGGRFSFPRGSEAGVCLHAVLEHTPFAAADWLPRVRQELSRAGYPPAWAEDVARWLRDCVQVALPDPAGGAAFALAAVEPRAAIREMAFHLTMREFAPRRLARLAQQYGLAVAELSAETLRGYLSGFIDLVVQHAGRWYVIDYKSNWLGAEPADYDAAALERAMADGDYHLQWLLYTLAVHRWLRSRVAGYDYDAHWGGSLYLFLRGINPQWRGADGRPTGVYAARPPRALVEALDACLDGSTAGAAS